MFKVKTIVLPDHYTLMDIAYIYTWKRDAPMRFFFRVIKNLQPVVKATPNDETTLESSKTVAVCQEFVKKEIKTEKDDNKMCETNNNSVSSVLNNNHKKHESIKLKIELSKQGNMVSILKSGPQPEKSDKIVKKSSENKDKSSSNSCEPLKQNPTIPKLLLLKSKDIKKEAKDADKLRETVKKIMKSQNAKEKKKLEVISENIVKKNSELFKKSQTKVNSLTIVPDIDPKKSEFLNAFQLAPRKNVSTVPPSPPSLSSLSPQKPLRFIAPKVPVPSLKPLFAYMGAMPKRKNKEPTKSGVNTQNTSNKKAKTNDLKQVLEKIIREKSNQNAANDKKETISFNLAPFPIGSSKVENTAKTPPLLPSSSANTSTTTKTSQSSTIDNQTLTNATASTVEKGSLPVSNSYPTNVTQNSPQGVNSSKSKNNVSPKQIVPKRPLSPTSKRSSLEPVFKKPMPLVKKHTPEKTKTPDNQKQPQKTSNSKKVTPPNFPPIAPRNVPFTPPHKPSNYLNFALLNSSKNDQMRMARPPIYSPFSPVYAPNSPQYTPNFNIQSRPTFKYTNPQAYANLMDNLYKTNELFPTNINNVPNAAPKPQVPPKANANAESAKKSPSPNEQRKSPQLPKKSVTPPILNPTANQMKSISPTMQNQDNKKPNANSLLNKLNFPSSLSVTLTTDTDDSRTNSPNNKTHSSVNNYIEIVKLPESPTSNHNNVMHSNGIPSGTSGNKTPPGCISPPKTIIKIDDVKKMGENVHKDIINKVNEMCSTNGTGTGTVQNQSPKSGEVENNLNKETFQAKFLESILSKLNDKVTKDEPEKPKTSPGTKTYSKANPTVSPGGTPPVYSKAVQNKLDELRKISPKPPQTKQRPVPNKASPTACPPLYDQRSLPPSQQLPPTPTNNYPTYDPTKLANLFNDFAQASQNPMQNMFPGMAPNPMTPYNTVPMVNLMQQAYFMEQWQKLQKFQKDAQQTYMENCLQNLKQNNNQTSSNRLE